MPGEPADIAGLELQRAGLYEELGRVGDFRRGSLNEVWRKCGKANCACAQPDHPGHGPQYNLTRSVGGKTVARHLRPGPELEKIRREVAESSPASRSRQSASTATGSRTSGPAFAGSAGSPARR